MSNKKKKQRETWKNTDTFLYALTVLWTTSAMAMTVVEFFQLKVPFKVPRTMPLAYFIFLITYVLNKEAMRWLKRVRKKKRGEYFLYAWWLLTFVLYLISSVSEERYQVSMKTLVTVTEVSGVYFLSLFSKKVFAETSLKRKPSKKTSKTVNLLEGRK